MTSGPLRRRDLVAMLGAVIVAAPAVARAQPSRRTPRIAVLWHAASATEEGPYLDAVRQGLRELGYVDGQTVTLDPGGVACRRADQSERRHHASLRRGERSRGGPAAREAISRLALARRLPMCVNSREILDEAVD